MDLVVGSTGTVGKAVALGLAARGRSVRALVRGGTAREEARPLSQAGVEIADGDLTRPRSLAAVCEGVEVVVCTATTMPHGRDDGLRRVDLEGTIALIDSAERAGVRRFVYVSYSGNLRHPSPLETAKRTCEDRLLRGRMRGVILRPSCFMEVWLGPPGGFDPARRTARVLGSGENLVSYISAGNVVEFAIAAAGEEGEEDIVLEMGGPQPVSQMDAVRIFEEVFGAYFEVERVPLEALHARHRSGDPIERTFAALGLGVAAGDVIHEARQNAARYDIRLKSVREHVDGLKASLEA